MSENNRMSEQIVLGTAMFDPTSLSLVFDVISSEQFFLSYPHRTVFDAIKVLYDNREPVDQFTVQNFLMEIGKLEEIGGDRYLSELYSYANPTRVFASATAIKRAYEDRSATSIIKWADTQVAQGQSPREVARQVVERLSALEESRGSNKVQTLHEVAESALAESYRNAERQTVLLGLSTGFRNLDSVTDGWQKKRVSLIAGRPSMGKTAFMLQLAIHQVDMSRPGIIFSLEMDAKGLAFRSMANKIQNTVSRTRKGILVQEDWTRLISVVSSWKGKPVFIDDTEGLTVEKMRDTVRIMKRRHGIEWVMVDYAQLVRSESKKGSREQDMQSVSSGLKSIAKSFDVAMIALAQLGRATEQRAGDKRPILSDLRESGGFEQDADFVGMLYRPGYYGLSTDESGNSYPHGYTELIVRKNRDGSTGEAMFVFSADTMAFTEYARPSPSDRADGEHTEFPF